MPEQPAVITIVLNWNGAQDTIRAVRSVQEMDYGANRLLVIDNDSRPESVAEVMEALGEGVEVVQTGQNLGYAGGNNFGIRLALERGAQYCLILNNDITVDSQMLAELVAVE